MALWECGKSISLGFFLNYLLKGGCFQTIYQGDLFLFVLRQSKGCNSRRRWHLTLSCVALHNELLQWSGATNLNFIFSRSSHSVLFNRCCYIIFLSSENKMFLLRRESRLLKKKYLSVINIIMCPSNVNYYYTVKIVHVICGIKKRITT